MTINQFSVFSNCVVFILKVRIIQIIQSQKEPQQITSKDKVCHACWLRTKSEALRNIQDISGSENMESETILLPKYRRAAKTDNHCLCDCLTVGILHSVADKLRAIILCNNNFFGPQLTCVCGVHLFRNSWDELYQSGNSINVFSADHVQHIFSLVYAFNPTLDFENIEIDNHIFEY